MYVQLKPFSKWDDDITSREISHLGFIAFYITKRHTNQNQESRKFHVIRSVNLPPVTTTKMINWAKLIDSCK